MVEFFQRAMKLLWWLYLSAIVATLIVIFAGSHFFGMEWLAKTMRTPVGQVALVLLVYSAVIGYFLLPVFVGFLLSDLCDIVYAAWKKWERRRVRAEREAHTRALREYFSARFEGDGNTLTSN